MAGGQRSENHPSRSVSRERFVIGQPQRWSGYGSNVKPTKQTTITEGERYQIGEGPVGIGRTVKVQEEPNITVGRPAGGVRRGGSFGQGPALEKNESGRGYHVKGAPGFRR